VAILPPPAVTRKPVKVAGAAKGKPVAQAKPRYRPAELMRAVTPNGADARTSKRVVPKPCDSRETKVSVARDRDLVRPTSSREIPLAVKSGSSSRL